MTSLLLRPGGRSLDPLRRRLDRIGPRNPTLARWLVRLIPGSCPFERTVNVGGREVLRIPPLCKLNPVYDQLVALRLRSLTLLAAPPARPH